MLTQDQLEARRKGLGGSDMAAVLGISPYSQPIDVFYDKRPDLAAEAGWVPDVVEGDHIDFGNYVEEPIAQLYAKRNDCKVRKSHKHHQHPKLPFMLANIDRKVEGVRRGLEIKSVNWRLAHLWGESGTGEVAEYYLPQIHHYMAVLDYPEWDAAALIGGATDYRDYRITRDKEWDDLILDGGRDFWENYVKPGIAPPIDLEHKKAAQALKKAYSLVTDEVVTLPEDALHWHQVAKEMGKIAKQYQDAADLAKRHLMDMAGTAGRVYIPGVKGAYLRKERTRAGYTVEPATYVDFRYSANAK